MLGVYFALARTAWLLFGVRFMRNILSVAAVSVAFFIGACSQSGTYYEKSPDDIALALSDAKMSPLLAGDVNESTVSRPNANKVIITGNDDFGGDVFRIVADLTPDGSGTLVSTKFELLHKKKGYDNYMAQQMATEHVAAAIEGRSVDVMAAANPIAKAIVNSNPEMSKAVNQGLNTAIAFEKMEEQAEFNKKYGDDWGANSASSDDGWGE